MKKIKEYGRRFALLIFLTAIGGGAIAAGAFDTPDERGRFTTVSCQQINHGHADVYRDNSTGREFACFDSPNGNRACVQTGR